MDTQTILKSIPIPYIATIGAIILLTLKALVLVSTPKIEKLFFTAEKNLFIRLLHVTIISLFLTAISVNVFEKYISLPNPELRKDVNFIAAYFLVCFIFTWIIVAQVYFSTFADYLGKESFYIEHEKHGKMYIIRLTNKNEVILYSQPRLYMKSKDVNRKIIILPIDDVKKEPILVESFGGNTLKNIYEYLKNKFSKNASDSNNDNISEDER
ncbi:hypothetical protein [Bacillus thuringiensis]|uniref:hypothetical protein n=1 Tax=Bacillus thuringiensis TaxID=1428 RepID=UPI000BFCA477|nr:hypothetical protein [Bacillus thuringiensis]PGL49020.1 hypothetical protein CN914_13320 [Bacillus thuringiensis]